MGFGIAWPSNTAAIINTIRHTIGREITIFVEVIGDTCPICTLDPVTNLSTDPFCVTCEGNYWINTVSAWTCSAHVRWKRTDQPLWVAGGLIDEGDCKITISGGVNASSGTPLYNVQHSSYFVVDGKELYMKNYQLRGVQDPNRIAVILLEDPNN